MVWYFDRAVDIDGNFRLFAKSSFLIGCSGNENWSWDSYWKMESGGVHGANAGVPWPDVSFRIRDDGFALRDSSADCVIKLL